MQLLLFTLTVYVDCVTQHQFGVRPNAELETDILSSLFKDEYLCYKTVFSSEICSFFHRRIQEYNAHSFVRMRSALQFLSYIVYGLLFFQTRCAVINHVGVINQASKVVLSAKHLYGVKW